MSLFTVGCPCEQIHMKLFTFGNPKWRNSYMTWFTCGVFQVKKLIWSGSLLACPKFRNLNDVVHFLRPKSRNSYMNRLTLGSKATKAMVHFWGVTHNLNLFEMIHGCLITWPMFPQGSSTSAINGMQFWSKMHFSPWTFFVPPIGQERFFPRASERRVLPIVGVCKTSSHLHIFSSSHLLIFTSSHLHMFLIIFSSSHFLLTFSHLLIFTSSHLLIFTFSHLQIFSSSHFLIFTFSHHLHIFTSSHPHIFASSHLHIFPSSHLHVFTSSHLHICSSSHLLIFTSDHLHIFSSSHLHIFTSSHLHIFSSCPLALSFFSISLLKAGAGAVPTRRHETQPFRTKRGSIAKNWSEIVISLVQSRPFRMRWGSIAQNWSKLRFPVCKSVCV